MISIITVCYNSASTILDTLLSVKSQSYKNYEHIIIDGGSSDNTVEIINNSKLSNLKLYVGPDKGIYDAMNKGISLSRGSIIGFLNSDDCFADNTILSNIFDAFVDSSVDCIYGDLTFVDRKSGKPLRKWVSSQYIPDAFSKGWHPAHPTFYCRKRVYDTVGLFNINIPISSDFDFMLRAIEVHKFNSIYIAKNLINMKIGGVSNRSILNVFTGFRGILFSFKINKINYSLSNIIFNRYLKKIISLI